MKCAYHTNGVLYDTVGVPTMHTFIMVISTPTVSYNTPLVWYAHFIFYSVMYVFVRYFVADIQSDCHAAPPETYA